MPMLLTPWESETRLVGMYIATGLLKGEQAQSVLLISPPGQGKTAMINRFVKLTTTRRISDLTSNGIRTLMRKDSNGQLRHLLMPELARLFSRDRSVSSQSANLLCNLMTGDAGVELIGIEEHDFTGRQVAVVGAMTADVFRQRREMLADTGMLSRFHLLPIERDEEERKRVVAAIANQNYDDLTPVQWPELRQAPREIKCSPSFGQPILTWLDSTDLKYDERFVSRIVVLLKACALLNNRSEVTDHDLRTLMTFTPFFEQQKDVRIVWPVK
jgi:hypothetical protein